MQSYTKATELKNMAEPEVPQGKIHFFLEIAALDYLTHIDYKIIKEYPSGSVKIEVEACSYVLTSLFHAGVQKGMADLYQNYKTA